MAITPIFQTLIDRLNTYLNEKPEAMIKEHFKPL